MAEAYSETTLERNRSFSRQNDQTSVDVEAVRLATARLHTRIQNLPVAEEKVAPVLAVRDDDLSLIHI